MKFPYNSGTGNEHDGNVDLNQSYLFDRVDEQTELLEGSGSRSGSTPLSSSSSYNSADNGSLKVYKPYSDEPTKIRHLSLLHDKMNKKLILRR